MARRGGSRSRSRRPKRRVARLARAAFVVLFAALGGWVAWKLVTWPDVASLAQRDPPTSAFIERWRARERHAGRSGTPQRIWVPYDAISPHLKRAVLVGEDINFFSHHGFAVDEIKRAVAEAIEEGESPRGASTITQQLAKNLWLSPSRSPLRKIEEAIIARQLERALSKKRIFELYLNVVEFGPGVFGAEAAARRYFDTSAAALSEEQAARLAAALPNPSRWNPAATSPRVERRARKIQERMEKARFLWREI